MGTAVAFGIGLTVLGAAAVAAAQEPLAVTTSLTEGRWIAGDEPIGLSLSRLLDPARERAAILIGGADWTDLFVRAGTTLTYRAGPRRLPSGESPLIVYLVTAPNQWQEIGRWTLRVLTPAGFERSEVAPRLDVANKGQIADVRRPDVAAATRGQFQDVTVGLGFRTLHARQGMSLASQINFVGVSNEREALRAGSAHAPSLDLADYLLAAENRRGRVAVGHLAFNPHRHLVGSFASRGVSGALRLARVDVAAAALNATSIVGLGNPLGVADRDHRLGLVTMGGELAAARPGAARLEGSFVSGSRLPSAGFSQGLISDAETSRGAGLRFLSSRPGSRVRLDAGASWSRFVNPRDALLDAGLTLVPARERTRDAQYLDAGVDLLRGARVGRWPAALTGTYRFERVEPLYRSIAASAVRADLLVHTAEVAGSLGQLSAQASESWSRDNLEDLESLLTTDTRVTGVNLLLPTSAFARPGTATAWWPVLTYTLGRIAQVGRGTPANGGFRDPSQVPDQVGTNQVLRAGWTGARWRAGYAVNRSLVDNRQPGRERADLLNLVHQVTAGGTPTPTLDVTVDLGLERATSRELDRVSRTRRVGLNASWRAARRSTLLAIVSRTALRDAGVSRSDLLDANLQLLQTVPLRRRGKPEAQLFVRWSWQSADVVDFLFGTGQDRRHWTVNTGLTVSLF